MPILAFNLFKTNGTHILKGKGKGTIIPVHITRAYLVSWGRAPLILTPGTWCRLAVNITAQPFYPWQNPGAHWTGGRVGSQIQTVRYREAKVSCPCQGPTPILVHRLITPPWLPIFWVIIYTIKFVYVILLSVVCSTFDTPSVEIWLFSYSGPGLLFHGFSSFVNVL